MDAESESDPDAIGCYDNDGVKYEVGDDIPSGDPCESWCVIIEPIAREDECCPSCRCVVNGTAYDIGDDIPNDDPCKTW